MNGVPSSPLRIALLIRALDVGGAERQLALLAAALARRGHRVAVFVFYGGRPAEAPLVEAGVAVHDLRKAGRWDVVRFGWRLVQALRGFAPDVLYSFLPSANVVAALVKPWIAARVVWGIRATNIQARGYDWLGRAVKRIEVALARRADGIIANSQAGYDHHVGCGYPAAKTTVIHNGIEAQAFRFDAGARLRLRDAWGVDDEEVLLGIVGRLDPIKGHEQFFAAAELLRVRHANVRFVVVGGGAAAREAALRATLPPALAPRVVWAGTHSDMGAVYSALDVLCSASLSEGWSNTLAEALLCGCACVASRVGDAAILVADARRLFDAGDVAAMVERMAAAVVTCRSADRAAGRARIEELCSVDRLVRETETFFRRVLAQPVHT